MRNKGGIGANIADYAQARKLPCHDSGGPSHSTNTQAFPDRQDVRLSLFVRLLGTGV